MRSRFRPLVSLVLSAALLLGCVGCGGSAKAPTTITVWNYYSGDLLSSFNALVGQFNATVGKEKNIVVESFNQGNVTDLEANVLAAAQGKVGAAALPNLYSGYADMAYDLDLMGKVVGPGPLSDRKGEGRLCGRFSVRGRPDEQRGTEDLPGAKSTELLYLNATGLGPLCCGHRCDLRRPGHFGRRRGGGPPILRLDGCHDQHPQRRQGLLRP